MQVPARAIFVALITTTTLLIGACSDSDGGSGSSAPDAPDVPDEQQPAVDALSAELVEQTGLDAEDADCMAAVLVDEAGIDEPMAYDEIPDLDEDTADRVADGFDDCVGLEEFFLATLTAVAEVDDADLDCARDSIDDEFMRIAVVSDLTGVEEAPPEFDAAMEDLASDCPDLVAALGAQAEPQLEPVD